MTKSEFRNKLVEAGIPFKEENFLNRFWGTRFIFDTSAVRKVQKLGTDVPIQRYNKDWAVEFY